MERQLRCAGTPFAGDENAIGVDIRTKRVFMVCQRYAGPGSIRSTLETYDAATGRRLNTAVIGMQQASGNQIRLFVDSLSQQVITYDYATGIVNSFDARDGLPSAAPIAIRPRLGLVPALTQITAAAPGVLVPSCGRLILVDGATGRLIALDYLKGAIVWAAQVGSGITSITVDAPRHRVIAASDPGVLRVIDLDRGDVRYATSLRGTASAPVLDTATGAILLTVTSNDAKLGASLIRLRADGREAWHADAAPLVMEPHGLAVDARARRVIVVGRNSTNPSRQVQILSLDVPDNGAAMTNNRPTT
jgi:hypothetical protein